MGLKMAHHSSKSKCDGSFHVKSNHAVVNCGVLNFLSIKLTFAVEYGEHMGMLAAILHVSSVTCYAQKPIFCVAFSALTFSSACHFPKEFSHHYVNA